MFNGRDVISISDFDRNEIERILDFSERMVPVAKGDRYADPLKGKILATLFFEPSTRTRLSFESAMNRLGGRVLGFAEPKGTSLAKGETLADTVRMAAAYSDVIVLRHPREGSARLAAKYSEKPVINGGDGAGQHPTQTLLDLFTIRQDKGKLDGLNVAILGDLKYGRTVHSLSMALTNFDTKIHLVSPKELRAPREVVNHLKERGTEVSEVADLEGVLDQVDVLYVTRIQKERFPDPMEYQRIAGMYRVDEELISPYPDLTIMHPLPRVNEIAPDVDILPQARYFNQAFNGVPVRMALLALVTGMAEALGEEAGEEVAR